MEIIIVRNEDVKRLLMGIPHQHRHLRTILEVKDRRYILQEAIIANIVRSYITLKTHPTRSGVELVQKRCEKRKQEYARYQLLESERDSEEVIAELSQIVGGQGRQG